MMNQARVWETLERIRTACEVSDERWDYVLCMKADEQVRLSKLGEPVPEYSLLRVAEHFDLSPESIIDERIDFLSLTKRHAGALTESLPERYLPGAGSKRRTSMHLLDYVEIKYGWRERERILRKFQISQAAMADPDASINILFLQDLCDHFLEIGMDKKALYEMGTYSVLANLNSPVADLFRQARSLPEIYEKLLLEVGPKRYDRNYDYRITKLTDERCVFEAWVNPEKADELKIRRLGSPGVCAEKAGLAACTSVYLNVPIADVVETACIHSGDECCRFEVNYELAAHVHGSRLNSQNRKTG